MSGVREQREEIPDIDDMAPERTVQWWQRPAVAVAGSGLVLLLVVAGIVSVPLFRYKEIRAIEAVVKQSNTLTASAMQNAAIFTGTPPEDEATLEDSVQQLSRLHDSLVLGHVEFAKSALKSALEYTDYTEGLTTKLAQVARAERDADRAIRDYNDLVAELKTAAPKDRSAIAQSSSEQQATARRTTEIAYQECQLLKKLTAGYGFAQRRALEGVPVVGDEVDSAIGALRPILEQAIVAAHIRRKAFNQAAQMSG